MLVALVGCEKPLQREERGVVAVPVVDAGTPADAVAPCFCFSWVHRDQNGQSCFPTKGTCDAEFKALGRTDKIACAAETDCRSYACRKSGKECVAR